MIAGDLVDRSGVPDIPLVDVDVHTPTSDEVLNKVVPSVPGITIEFDEDLGAILDKLQKVHDYFSPFGSDAAAQAMMKRAQADMLETNEVNRLRIKRKAERKKMLLLAFVVGVGLGRSRGR